MNSKYYYLLIVLLLVGCGENAPYQLVSVEGLVTLDSKPLPNAMVTFQPGAPPGREAAGPGSVGRTDKEGRFVLETVRTDEPGAVVGPHRIIIFPIQYGENQAPNLPSRYNEQTILTFEVAAEGTQSADFHLTSDP